MAITLRGYQLEAIEAVTSDIKSGVNPLCVLLMGSGKTEIFIEVIKRYLATTDKNVVVLLNKVSLLEQTIKRIKDSLGEVSVYCGSLNYKDMNKRVTIATVQSINSAPSDARVGLIVVDEVHNLGEKGYYRNFINNNPQAIVYGTTATPFRTVSGVIYGPEELFKKITYQKSMLWMIEQGYLVKPLLKKGNYQFDTSKLRIIAGEFNQKDVSALVDNTEKVELQIIDALSRSQDRKCFVWACATIKHCETVYTMLRNKNESVVQIHSEMSLEERSDAEALFRSGKSRHLVFVSIVAEGFNHPPIDCVVLMRPIRSPVLYLQICGRGLRISEGKEDLLILDYGKVIESIGPLDNPKIKFKKRRLSGGGEVEESEMKACRNCLEYVPRKERVCPVCSTEFFAAPRDPVKNLTREADQESALLFFTKDFKKYTMSVSKVSFLKHNSKGGNDCVKIVYYSGNIFEPPMSEYFVWGQSFAMRNLNKRLKEIGMKTSTKEYDNLEVFIKACKNNLDLISISSISYIKENGFNKVTSANA